MKPKEIKFGNHKHKFKVINLTPFTRKCIICNKEEVYEWEDNKTPGRKTD